METKIIKEENNPFLGRTEITLEIKNEVAPSLEEVKAAIGRDADLTVVKKVNTNFGKQIFIAEAVVYDNAEAKGKIETIPQKVRKKMEAEKKAAAEAVKKAEESKEAPVEETKEETSTEEPAQASVPSEEGKESKEEEPKEETSTEEPTETKEEDKTE